MVKGTFFNVHKDFAQDAGEQVIYGHEEHLGLEENAAKALYHQLLASVYAASDPWSHVYITRSDGLTVFGELVDRRTAPSPEPDVEG